MLGRRDLLRPGKALAKELELPELEPAARSVASRPASSARANLELEREVALQAAAALDESGN